MIYDRYGQFTFRESDERRRVAAQRVAAAEPCPEPAPREDTHGPPSRPSVTFFNSKWFSHYCSCPTIRDWIAVYPALFFW